MHPSGKKEVIGLLIANVLLSNRIRGVGNENNRLLRLIKKKREEIIATEALKKKQMEEIERIGQLDQTTFTDSEIVVDIINEIIGLSFEKITENKFIKDKIVKKKTIRKRNSKKSKVDLNYLSTPKPSTGHLNRKH